MTRIPMGCRIQDGDKIRLQRASFLSRTSPSLFLDPFYIKTKDEKISII